MKSLFYDAPVTQAHAAPTIAARFSAIPISPLGQAMLPEPSFGSGLPPLADFALKRQAQQQGGPPIGDTGNQTPLSGQTFNFAGQPFAAVGAPYSQAPDLSGQTLNFADMANAAQQPPSFWSRLPWNSVPTAPADALTDAMKAGYGGSPLGSGLFSP